MKIKNIQTWIYSLSFLAVVSCKPTIDTPELSKGSADFSKYIAVGNSLTAGYADNGLYLEGQKVAYPNLIAAQMKAVGGGNFTSPFFTDAQSDGSGYVKLTGFNADGTPIVTPVADKLAYRSQQPLLLTKHTEEVQNLGIPGMRLDLGYAAPTFSGANMYFERLLNSNQVDNTTYFDFIQNRNHTFFSFWLGNNDILGWATAGGDAGTDPTKQRTDKTQFAQLYTAFITSLTSNGQKGAVATIPDVTSVPFFNTKTVALINAGLKANPQTANLPGIFINALNPSTNTYQARLATAEDLIILTFDTGIIGSGPGYGLDQNLPIENKYVLDKEEVRIAKDYVTSYNNSIKQIAEAKGLALVDTYTILNDIKSGKDYDGIHVSSSYITGNAFSLDGVHLTPIGNAVIANEFIKAINAKYSSTIPPVNVANYSGVKFP